MDQIEWLDSLEQAESQAAESGKLVLTYVFAPG